MLISTVWDGASTYIQSANELIHLSACVHKHKLVEFMCFLVASRHVSKRNVYKDTERSRQGAYRHQGSFTCVALGPKGPLWVAISQTVPKPYNSSYLPNRCELGALPCTKHSPPSCASFSSRGRAAARAPPFPIFPFPPHWVAPLRFFCPPTLT